MKKIMIFTYGLICYLLACTTYFIILPGFVGDWIVPELINTGIEMPFGQALLVNLGLIILFGLPHSLMARQQFKQWWAKLAPPAAERSTYLLQSSLFMLLLIWQWRPMPGIIWQIEHALGTYLLGTIFWLGWLMALIAVFLINHFELTGLQQVYAYTRNKPATPPDFRTPFLYRLVRHPMQLGIMLVFWSTSRMTVGHLVFAVGMTVYIFIGLYFEERDLVRHFGETYRAYQRRTPMLLPLKSGLQVKEQERRGLV